MAIVTVHLARGTALYMLQLKPAETVEVDFPCFQIDFPLCWLFHLGCNPLTMTLAKKNETESLEGVKCPYAISNCMVTLNSQICEEKLLFSWLPDHQSTF